VATHEAFLQAICEEPDDDVHRLVFADWLDEHGDPHRAEFIRLQCDLARWLPHDDEAEPLAEREQHLLNRHRPAWEAPVVAGLDLTPPPGHPTVPLRFRRGFVDQVCLSAAQFLEHAATLRRRTPLQGWTVTDHPPGALAVRDLARSRTLAGLAELDLRGRSLEDPDVIALAGSPHLAGLGILRLGTPFTVPYPGRLNVNPIRALTHSPHLAGLHTLDLSGQRLGQGSFEVLLRSPLGARLRELNWARNRIRDFGLTELAGSLPALQVLRLGNNRLTAAGMPALIGAAFARGLLVLDLGNRPGEARGNAIGDVGLAAFAGASFPALRALSLARNAIGDEGFTAFVRGASVPDLRVLSLPGNHLRAGSTWALAASPLREQLRELYLAGNHLSDRAVEVFLDLPWPRLRGLDLTGNPIGASRWRALRKRLGARLVGGPE
jgi:uncharacterized protein (TIGR02996 family)